MKNLLIRHHSPPCCPHGLCPHSGSTGLFQEFLNCTSVWRRKKKNFFRMLQMDNRKWTHVCVCVLQQPCPAAESSSSITGITNCPTAAPWPQFRNRCLRNLLPQHSRVHSIAHTLTLTVYQRYVVAGYSITCTHVKYWWICTLPSLLYLL